MIEITQLKYDVIKEREEGFERKCLSIISGPTW